MTAVADGESLRLRLLLHNDAKCTSAYLLIQPDDGQEFTIEMHYTCQSDENYGWWECEFSLPEGLYWYSFYYFGEGGRHQVTKHRRGEGLVSTEGGKWQLTVYSKDFSTPKWPLEGIIYQIFPDRFYASGQEKKNVPTDRFMRRDWGGTPAWANDGSPCSICKDYFGGDIKGITEKLDYIASLGVSCIYLNPIFEAHSNHRYNTADYMKIDPLLGDEEDFKQLCTEAKKRNIGIILDGVFSHTGDDSIYFNKYGRYTDLGACQSTDSPYRSWYNFDASAIGYRSWWGVPTLPEVNEEDENYDRFINSAEGVVRHWLRLGASGWRLDVADELPDKFLDNLRLAAKAEKDDCYILGEVWEDATNKISYGYRRRFLRGNQLDSVMNYPFANAIIDFVRGGKAEALTDTVLDIIENYPPQSVNLLMNHIGTHDTARALTALGEGYCHNPDRCWQSQQKLDAHQRETAVSRLKLAAVLQYTLPGIPSLYYGDEAGLEGYTDPFCRGCFPWGKANTELTEFYRTLG
ncbi:MAG: glycoside hydrolase family 13 protein, partial [Clostridia bacterium]|nr:glycoside hydrolase family 13 protein [Clostridia bacterium]